MKTALGLTAAAFTLAGAVFAAENAATDYAPMQPFDVIAGKNWRGEWQDPDGKKVVDYQHWEYILGGKACS